MKEEGFTYMGGNDFHSFGSVSLSHQHQRKWVNVRLTGNVISLTAFVDLDSGIVHAKHKLHEKKEFFELLVSNDLA